MAIRRSPNAVSKPAKAPRLNNRIWFKKFWSQRAEKNNPTRYIYACGDADIILAAQSVGKAQIALEKQSAER